MADFIANNMARELPLALCFLVGVYLIQMGLKRIASYFRIYPVALFIIYWLLLSIDAFKGIGPTAELDWINVVGIYALPLGVVFYVACFLLSFVIKRKKAEDAHDA